MSQRGLAPLLGHLRGHGVVPVPAAVVADTACEVLLGRYRCYLVGERGLAVATVDKHERAARMFLAHRCRTHGGDLGLEDLNAGEVVGFVTAACPGRTVGTAKIIVTGLRSLLRFLHLTGRVPIALVGAVPGVAGWRGAALPKALTPAQIQALLGACDRRRSTGRRDFAIVVLLARLGLRAGEAVAIELDDIDWRAGELVIRGKGNRRERLPLPVDVGEAIVGYLRRGRPAGPDRGLFLRTRAPYGPISTAVVKGVVRRAGERAGLEGHLGAHRLRHTAATEMLRASASLPEVGQVLRHRSLSTTAIYAKVDRAAMTDLALPWPGGER